MKQKRKWFIALCLMMPQIVMAQTPRTISSGRDQGHAQMACMVAAQLCQVVNSLYKANPAYESLDFFSLNDYMVLQMTIMSELTKDDKPTLYYNKVKDQTTFRSPVERR
ncbi:MAG: hypothetical protein IJ612_00795 [Prevotella sp.]|nr:hypothetical protein [Prevotella sp.]